MVGHSASGLLQREKPYKHTDFLDSYDDLSTDWQSTISNLFHNDSSFQHGHGRHERTRNRTGGRNDETSYFSYGTASLSSPEDSYRSDDPEDSYNDLNDTTYKNASDVNRSVRHGDKDSLKVSSKDKDETPVKVQEHNGVKAISSDAEQQGSSSNAVANRSSGNGSSGHSGANRSAISAHSVEKKSYGYSYSNGPADSSGFSKVPSHLDGHRSSAKEKEEPFALIKKGTGSSAPEEQTKETRNQLEKREKPEQHQDEISGAFENATAVEENGTRRGAKKDTAHDHARSDHVGADDASHSIRSENLIGANLIQLPPAILQKAHVPPTFDKIPQEEDALSNVQEDITPDGAITYMLETSEAVAENYVADRQEKESTEPQKEEQAVRSVPFKRKKTNIKKKLVSIGKKIKEIKLNGKANDAYSLREREQHRMVSGEEGSEDEAVETEATKHALIEQSEARTKEPTDTTSSERSTTKSLTDGDELYVLDTTQLYDGLKTGVSTMPEGVEPTKSLNDNSDHDETVDFLNPYVNAIDGVVNEMSSPPGVEADATCESAVENFFAQSNRQKDDRYQEFSSESSGRPNTNSDQEVISRKIFRSSRSSSKASNLMELRGKETGDSDADPDPDCHSTTSEDKQTRKSDGTNNSAQSSRSEWLYQQRTGDASAASSMSDGNKKEVVLVQQPKHAKIIPLGDERYGSAEDNGNDKGVFCWDKLCSNDFLNALPPFLRCAATPTTKRTAFTDQETVTEGSYLRSRRKFQHEQQAQAESYVDSNGFSEEPSEGIKHPNEGTKGYSGEFLRGEDNTSSGDSSVVAGKMKTTSKQTPQRIKESSPKTEIEEEYADTSNMKRKGRGKNVRETKKEKAYQVKETDNGNSNPSVPSCHSEEESPKQTKEIDVNDLVTRWEGRRMPIHENEGKTARAEEDNFDEESERIEQDDDDTSAQVSFSGAIPFETSSQENVHVRKESVTKEKLISKVRSMDGTEKPLKQDGDVYIVIESPTMKSNNDASTQASTIVIGSNSGQEEKRENFPATEGGESLQLSTHKEPFEKSTKDAKDNNDNNVDGNQDLVEGKHSTKKASRAPERKERNALTRNVTKLVKKGTANIKDTYNKNSLASLGKSIKDLKDAHHFNLSRTIHAHTKDPDSNIIFGEEYEGGGSMAKPDITYAMLDLPAVIENRKIGSENDARVTKQIQESSAQTENAPYKGGSSDEGSTDFKQSLTSGEEQFSSQKHRKDDSGKREKEEALKTLQRMIAAQNEKLVTLQVQMEKMLNEKNSRQKKSVIDNVNAELSHSKRSIGDAVELVESLSSMGEEGSVDSVALNEASAVIRNNRERSNALFDEVKRLEREYEQATRRSINGRNQEDLIEPREYHEKSDSDWNSVDNKGRKGRSDIKDETKNDPEQDTKEETDGIIVRGTNKEKRMKSRPKQRKSPAGSSMGENLEEKSLDDGIRVKGTNNERRGRHITREQKDEDAKVRRPRSRRRNKEERSHGSTERQMRIKGRPPREETTRAKEPRSSADSTEGSDVRVMGTRRRNRGSRSQYSSDESRNDARNDDDAMNTLREGAPTATGNKEELQESVADARRVHDGKVMKWQERNIVPRPPGHITSWAPESVGMEQFDSSDTADSLD